MTDIWVTPLACSTCRIDHERDDYDGECDHWCHDAGAEDWEDDGGE